MPYLYPIFALFLICAFSNCSSPASKIPAVTNPRILTIGNQIIAAPGGVHKQMLLNAIAVPDPKVMRRKYERLTE